MGVAYEPINTIQPISSDIWIVDGPVVRMKIAPGLSLPFPTRMTIIRLGNGSLILHSPTEYSTALASTISLLGEIRHLISPNCFHYTHIPTWKTHFPEAMAWASPGIESRIRKHDRSFEFDAALSHDVPPWLPEVQQFEFAGSWLLREFVFFHRSSRTLILTDLVQNFEPHKLSRAGRWLAMLGGCLAPNGSTPLEVRLSFLGGRAKAAQSLRDLRVLDARRIIISHGRFFDRDAPAELERIFGWVSLHPF